MWPSKFEILREAEDGSGGGGYPAPMSDRERALEARVNQLATSLDTMRKSTQQTAAQTQLAQAKAQVDQSVTEAENLVNSAETSLLTALESSDPGEIARAQRKLADAAASAERKRADRDAFTAQLKQQEHRGGGTRNESVVDGPKIDTSNLDKWKDKHKTWYGVDPEMTRVSHEIDAGIRQSKQYTVGSPEYFAAIDNALRTRFPNRFSGAPASASARSGDDSNSSSPRRYDREVQRSMEAFGLSPEAWDAARKKAVQKGFLSAEPARGRVLN